MNFEFPRELAEALERETARIAPSAAMAAVRDIQRRYRAGPAGEGAVRSAEDAALYAAFRVPATYAAARRALEEVRKRKPDFSPATVFDAGAGPGTALWAADDIWPSIRSATLLEKSRAMISLGQRLMNSASPRLAEKTEWEARDLASGPSGGTYDLVIASYALGELSPEKLDGAVRRLAESTAGIFIVVEPSLDSRTSLMVERVRTAFLAAGFFMLAPCPHSAPCARREKDWCHFAQRLERTKMQRLLKGGELPFEDEKFIYAAFSRTPGLGVKGTLTRQPSIRKGHIVLEVCTPAGLKTASVGKSKKEAYRLARKASWGEAVGDDALGALL